MLSPRLLSSPCGQVTLGVINHVHVRSPSSSNSKARIAKYLTDLTLLVTFCPVTDMITNIACLCIEWTVNTLPLYIEKYFVTSYFNYNKILLWTEPEKIFNVAQHQSKTKKEPSCVTCGLLERFRFIQMSSEAQKGKLVTTIIFVSLVKRWTDLFSPNPAKIEKENHKQCFYVTEVHYKASQLFRLQVNAWNVVCEHALCEVSWLCTERMCLTTNNLLIFAVTL